MLTNNRKIILGKISCTLMYIPAFVLISSGFLKLSSPNQSMKTISVLFEKILTFSINPLYLSILLFILIFIEIILGILYISNVKVRLLNWLFLLITVGFISISHYLNQLGGLKSCGCFGSISDKMYSIHLPLLYIMLFIIIFRLYFLIKYNNQAI